MKFQTFVVSGLRPLRSEMDYDAGSKTDNTRAILLDALDDYPDLMKLFRDGEHLCTENRNRG